MDVEHKKHCTMSIMNEYIVIFYNVDPKTFKRIRMQQTIKAYDQDHAKRIVDRHPSLIKSIKKVN